MTPIPSIQEMLQTIYERCGALFTLDNVRVEFNPPSWSETEVPPAAWIPAALREYGQQVGVFWVEWTLYDTLPQKPEGKKKKKGKKKKQAAPAILGTGAIWLHPIVGIYADWSEELSLKVRELSSEDPLHDFQVIDSTNDALYVGLYNTSAQDPGLYLIRPHKGYAPYPLFVDIKGYLKLLNLTLGYAYWQWALLQLLPDDGHNPGYFSDQHFLDKLSRDLGNWLPDFSRDKFIGVYNEVKLKDYIPRYLPRD